MEAMKSFKSLRSYAWMRGMLTDVGWSKAKQMRRLHWQMLGFMARFFACFALGGILVRIGC